MIIWDRRPERDESCFDKFEHADNENDERRFENTTNEEKKNLICGKCGTLQLMTKRTICKGTSKECFTWWCPNCKDQISNSAVKEEDLKDGT